MRIMKCRVGQYATTVATVPGFVYCDRAFHDYPASPLRNPYWVGQRYGTLPEVLALYRKWLHASITGSNVYSPCALPHFYAVNAAMKALTEQSVLGCWCVDKAEAGTGDEQCHCDVIAKAHAWLQRQKSESGATS